jgi:hypothetical protein
LLRHFLCLNPQKIPRNDIFRGCLKSVGVIPTPIVIPNLIWNPVVYHPDPRAGLWQGSSFSGRRNGGLLNQKILAAKQSGVSEWSRRVGFGEAILWIAHAEL